MPFGLALIGGDFRYYTTSNAAILTDSHSAVVVKIWCWSCV